LAIWRTNIAHNIRKATIHTVFSKNRRIAPDGPGLERPHRGMKISDIARPTGQS